jgi:hypothetical protein
VRDNKVNAKTRASVIPAIGLSVRVKMSKIELIAKVRLSPLNLNSIKSSMYKIIASAKDIVAFDVCPLTSAVFPNLISFEESGITLFLE